jgi:hypothetical protein
MPYYAGRQNFTFALFDTAWEIIGLFGTARAGLSEFKISSDAAPSEGRVEYSLYRTGTDGTGPGGNSTVVKLDSVSPNAACTFSGGGYASEPTVGDRLMDLSVHRRETFEWSAYPGCEIWSANDTNFGLGLVVQSATSLFSINVSCVWLE